MGTQDTPRSTHQGRDSSSGLGRWVPGHLGGDCGVLVPGPLSGMTELKADGHSSPSVQASLPGGVVWKEEGQGGLWSAGPGCSVLLRSEGGINPALSHLPGCLPGSAVGRTPEAGASH